MLYLTSKNLTLFQLRRHTTRRRFLRLQLRSLSRGVPSSHLEKDERLILEHICIYS